MSGKEIDTVKADHGTFSTQAARAPWTRPRVQKMAAGDAENAFTQAVDDGPFTRS